MQPGHEPGIHINFWLVLLVGAAFCALLASSSARRPCGCKSDYLALVTLGFGEIIPQIFHNGDDIVGFNLTNGTKGITRSTRSRPVRSHPGRPGATSDAFDNTYKFLVYCCWSRSCMFVSLRIRDGRLGRAWLAIREDELRRA